MLEPLREEGTLLCPPWVGFGAPPGIRLVFSLQKYNADYDLSATQSADTLAFVSLLEEKLLPVLVRLQGRGTCWGWGVLPGAVQAGLGVPSCQQQHPGILAWQG